MDELVVALLPEMVGLVVTPGAVVACLLLLVSSRPVRNVTTLAGAFLVVYAVLAGVVLVTGRSAGAGTEHAEVVRGWTSLVLGVLFLAGAVLSWVRRPRPGVLVEGARAGGLVERLREPSWRGLVTGALALALLNPNVAILASGVGVVLTADVSPGEQLVGVLLLLAASMLDFVVPSALYVVSGGPGRATLRRAAAWLVRHQVVIGVLVLAGFGLLFTGRGIGHLTG